MTRSQGFSLPQVLVSLALMTGTSIPLFQHLWHMQQQYNALKSKAHTLEYIDNHAERECLK